jgi:methylmalonyl-CoA/ethylmalonyl-CoA epimerase
MPLCGRMGDNMLKNLEPQLICQVGVMVKDVEEAAAKLSKMFGLAIRKRNPVGNLLCDYDCKTVYKGLNSDSSCYNLVLDFGNIQIEFMQPYGDVPSVWRDFYDEHGEGIHHLAWQVKNTGEAADFFKAMGIEQMQTGCWQTGQYTYFDTSGQLGFIIEALEFWDAK